MAAWRDALFGDDSPIRKLLDSEVTLRRSDGESTTYQAGRESTGGTAEHEALAIPEHLVLSRSLTLPSIAEADLEAALQLEIAACSPFPRMTPQRVGVSLGVAMRVSWLWTLR